MKKDERIFSEPIGQHLSRCCAMRSASSEREETMTGKQYFCGMCEATFQKDNVAWLCPSCGSDEIEPHFIDIQGAIEIVLTLARQAKTTPLHRVACDTLEDFAANNLGDDS